MLSVFQKAIIVLYLLFLSADYGYLIQSRQVVGNGATGFDAIHWACNSQGDQVASPSDEDIEHPHLPRRAHCLAESGHIPHAIGAVCSQRVPRYQLQPRTTQGPPQYTTV